MEKVERPLLEIERKFLIEEENLEQIKWQASSCSRISQGYICAATGRTVRVRIRDSKGYLTIKGPSSLGGLSRFEWEREISLGDAEALMGITLPGRIEKTRYLVPYKGHTFEVDEFFGEHKGLILAEVELSSEDEDFEAPEWLGREVTGDPHYYNSYLCGMREMR